MNAQGTVFKYGDNIDTDVIIPARYLNTQNAKELAAHCMEDIDKTFITRVQPGDIMVGGENFGCGSSREHAPLAIKAETVIRLRSRGESLSSRDQTSPKRTSSFNSANLGANLLMASLPAVTLSMIIPSFLSDLF